MEKIRVKRLHLFPLLAVTSYFLNSHLQTDEALASILFFFAGILSES